jgi:hypothetical protein
LILLLVPVLCAAVGLVLYGAMRATGAFGSLDSGGGSARSAPVRSEPVGIRERISDLSPGCLIAVVATAGVWIVGWLIVLAVGLNLLT